MANILRKALRRVVRPTRKFILNQVGPVGQIQLRMNEDYLRNYRLPRRVNLRNPQRLSEKILWLLLFERYDDAHILADKIAVREFVKERIGAEVLVPLAATYDDPEQISMDEFPDHFVVKPNHASGMILFGTKDTADRDEIVAKCHEWLKVDYSEVSGEYQYSKIPRRIMVEEDLRHLSGTDDIIDYKFFCFSGKPQFVLVISGRLKRKTLQFYDMKWERLPFSLEIPTAGDDMAPPQGFDFMKLAAERLSEGRTFVRVDFYEINYEVLFSEITFHPSGGRIIAFPDRYDLELGKLLTLPELPR